MIVTLYYEDIFLSTSLLEHTKLILCVYLRGTAFSHPHQIDLLRQGSANFFTLRTGLKLKFCRGPAFKKPQMFSNEYLLQLV